MKSQNSLEQSIKDRLKIKRAETMVPFDILKKKYFIDCFLKLLSRSKYSENFVWKGGFVLSVITGIEKRTTVDLDTLVQGISVNIKNLRNIIYEIISLSEAGDPEFQLVDIENIQEEKAYQGLRIRLNARLGQMRDSFHLDVVTGETLEQKAIKWKYQPLLEQEKIPIYIYHPEQILAEKMQTILQRGLANTRMKDFYDIYIIPMTTDIDSEIITKDFKLVMNERKTAELWSIHSEILDLVVSDKKMNNEWLRYSKTHIFVGNISFEDVINSARQLFNKMSY